jgi:hypothetical protein
MTKLESTYTIFTELFDDAETCVMAERFLNKVVALCKAAGVTVEELLDYIRAQEEAIAKDAIVRDYFDDPEHVKPEMQTLLDATAPETTEEASSSIRPYGPVPRRPLETGRQRPRLG